MTDVLRLRSASATCFLKVAVVMSFKRDNSSNLGICVYCLISLAGWTCTSSGVAFLRI